MEKGEHTTTSRSWSRIASLLAVLVPAFAKIIGAAVDDDSPLQQY